MGRRLSSSFFHRPSPCSTEYAIHLRGPTWLQLGAARSERQGWLQAIAKRLALDGHEHGASLGWSVELSRQWAKRRQFEAELAMRGAQIAPQPCIRLIREDRNHDAVIRIGGEAPGRQAHSSQRLESHGFSVGSLPPRIVIGRPYLGTAQVLSSCCLLFPLLSVITLDVIPCPSKPPPS